MIGEVKGLPLGYLLGQSSTQTESEWHELPIEETFSSLEGTDLNPQASSTAISEEALSALKKDRRDQLKLK